MAQPLCTDPTALPRCCARITSPMSTAPAAHSPPKPRPIRARQTASCSKFCVKPCRKVKNANHTMVICKVRTRPKQSASMPANHPPNADSSSVLVASRPACVLEMCQMATSVGMTKP